MSAGVLVAGVGVITGTGNNAAECINSLRKGETGVGKIRYLKTNHSGVLPAAEVKLSNTDLAALSDFAGGVSRNVMLRYSKYSGYTFGACFGYYHRGYGPNREFLH
jgi:3-oxoacyl-(acyl-carrier-protein) synthase